ncbi:DUF6882 domain-containing protein [Cellvibrio sp.]|uniref:DUF6882 domain-containing protein n=1 Tax=Cellvibrio sp. TaxID=1965322 RepID=UPI00396476C8
MNDQDFELFLTTATNELKEKQANLTSAYGFGSHKRWMFESDKAKLQFFNQDDQLVLEAEIVDIGSYSPANKTWKWAWAYESINPVLKAESLRIKELEDITDATIFGEKDPVEADEYLAWELAAMAVKHLNALGCYRAFSSARNVNMFFAITEVRVIS